MRHASCGKRVVGLLRAAGGAGEVELGKLRCAEEPGILYIEIHGWSIHGWFRFSHPQCSSLTRAVHPTLTTSTSIRTPGLVLTHTCCENKGGSGGVGVGALPSRCIAEPHCCIWVI